MKISSELREFALSGKAEVAILGTGDDELRKGLYALRHMIANSEEKHSGLTFGAALSALKEGYRVYREDWKSDTSMAVLEIVNVDFHAPYFRMGHFQQGDEPFYIVGGPNLEDMMADDWAIALDEAEESLRP